MGFVNAIYICPDKGQQMVSVQTAMAIQGEGLRGDRYSVGRGTWSKTDTKNRQVTLIAKEAIDGASGMALTPFLPEHTRRNIVTFAEDLESLIGKEFMIGNVAVFRGIKECDPCDKPRVLRGLPKDHGDFAQIFAGRGGIRAEVIQGGVIYTYQRFTIL